MNNICLLTRKRSRDVPIIYFLQCVAIDFVLPILPNACRDPTHDRKGSLCRKMVWCSSGSCRGTCIGSRCMVGRGIRKPDKHTTTDQEQHEEDSADNNADAVTWAVGRRWWWC